MFLKKLKLVNFRNYADFEQNFNSLKNIIIGQNAQGKSNILEAINIIATSESPKAERDSELILFGRDHAVIYARIESKKPENEIALQINSGGRRQLKINGVTKKAPQADLLGNFLAVMFSCDDIYLIKGSPSNRRRWLDLILFQLDTKYHKTLVGYQKNITQKNALLKKAQEEGIPKKNLKDELEIWNEQIIKAGSEIILSRINFLDKLEEPGSDFLNKMSKQSEKLELTYSSTIQGLERTPNKTKINELFKTSIKNAFDEELVRGQSVIGPHRDDIEFLINKKDAKAFASQGQQRSIILAIKLAELKVIEKIKDDVPVLLLDDVFAELDEIRQDFLLHNLRVDMQTFLTTTHMTDIQKKFLKDAIIYEIKDGKIYLNET